MQRSDPSTEEWPRATAPGVFAGRRQRLGAAYPGPAVFASGVPKVRNFPSNTYPFRAESHFLYLVGWAGPGALLALSAQSAVLYVDPPHPDENLWVGPAPTETELSTRLGLEVRPLDAFEPPAGVATLPPQDSDTAAWLASFLGRPIEAGAGDELTGMDAELADAMIVLRLTHDPAALWQLRDAARVTCGAQAAAMRATRGGLREAVVAAAATQFIESRGCCHAYAPIVTVRGEVLHNPHHDGVLREGDLLLADVGAETPEGWASDVTRTWPVSGRFSPTQRAVYEVVQRAQQSAIDAIRPGARFLDVHRRAGLTIAEGLVELGISRGAPAELVERGVVALFFPHGIGHLLGMDVHDLEDLGDRAGYGDGRLRSQQPGDRFLRLDRDLVADMVVTIEPGFYQIPSILHRDLGALESYVDRAVLARFADVRGIRIEDDVRVVPSGADVLTEALPRNVAEIETVVGSA